MPCDSVILNRVEIGKMHPDLLQKALVRMGANIIQTGSVTQFVLNGTTCAISGGVLTTRSRYGNTAASGAIADQVKQAYSGEVVRMTAAKRGWQIQQTGPHSYKVKVTR